MGQGAIAHLLEAGIQFHQRGPGNSTASIIAIKKPYKYRTVYGRRFAFLDMLAWDSNFRVQKSSKLTSSGTGSWNPIIYHG